MEEEDRVGGLINSLGVLGVLSAMAPVFKRPQGRMAAELHFPAGEAETMNKTLAWLTKKNQGGKIRGVDRKSDPMVFRFEAPDNVYDAIDRRIQQLSESTAGTSTPVKAPQMQSSPAVNPVQQPVAHQPGELNPFRAPLQIESWESPTKSRRTLGGSGEAYVEVVVPKGSREERVRQIIAESGGEILDDRQGKIFIGNNFRDVELPGQNIAVSFKDMNNPVFDYLGRRDKIIQFERELESRPDVAKQYYDLGDQVFAEKQGLEALRSRKAEAYGNADLRLRYADQIKEKEIGLDDIQFRINTLRESLGY